MNPELNQEITDMTLNHSDTEAENMGLNGTEPEEWYSVETSGNGYSTSGSDYKNADNEGIKILENEKTQGDYEQELYNLNEEMEKLLNDLEKYDNLKWYENAKGIFDPEYWKSIKYEIEMSKFIKKHYTDKEIEEILKEKPIYRASGIEPKQMQIIWPILKEKLNNEIATKNQKIYEITNNIKEYDNRTDEQKRNDNQYQRLVEDLRAAGLNPAILNASGGGSGGSNSKSDEEEEKRKKRKREQELKKQAQKHAKMQLISQLLQTGGKIGTTAMFGGLGAANLGLNAARLKNQIPLNEARAKYFDERAFNEQIKHLDQDLQYILRKNRTKR